ncbi:MAG: class III signal peptide-containing protein [Methanobacteriaceae archaeon]|nr:class III signal peptide-containing protein [Methanobacteriaceae archaeon]
MSFLKDESGQGAAEYILLFGGVIVIAIAALYIYYSYFIAPSSVKVGDDIATVRSTVGS